MALPDLTGQNIENTYQRVLQTEGTVIYDGTGSIFLPVSASYAVTASYAEYAVSASHEIIKEVSSSYADYAQESGLSTSSISASYAITASYALNSPDTFPYTGSAIISGSLEVDGTTKLDGDTTITGSNSLAGNYALKVTNTSGADILNIENNNKITLGTTPYTPNDSGEVSNSNVYAKGGIYVANTANNFGMSYEGNRIKYNNGLSRPTFTGTNSGFQSSGEFRGTTVRGDDGLQVGGGIGNEVGVTGGSDLDITFTGQFGVGLTSGQSWMRLNGPNRTSKKGQLELHAGTDPNFAYITLNTNTNERMRITHSGSIGIGLEDPQTNLHVSGAISSSTYYGDGSNLTGISSDPFPYTGDVEITGSNSLAGNYAFKVANSSGTDLLKAENDGKVYLRNPSHTSGDINSTGSIVHYGNLTLGPVTSNAPDRKLTIAGYDGAQVEFNLHNGWGKPTIEAHYDGTIKYINYGANSTNLAFQFGESVSRQGSMRFYTNSDEAIKFGTNTGYPLAYIGVVEQPNNYNGGLVIKSRNGTTQTNTWTFGRYGDLDAPGNISASGHVSASTYYGDGSNLTGISSDPFPYTGSAVISGSLILTGSFNAQLPTSSTDTYFITYNTSSYSLEARQVATLINPQVEYTDITSSISSGTSITLPNGLSYISSSVYEYLEVFVNGLRLRYDIDFIPTSTTTIQTQISFPSGSELTFKSLKT